MIRAVKIIYNTSSVSKKRYQRKTKTRPISQNFSADFVVRFTRTDFATGSFSEIHSIFFVSLTLVSVSVFFIKTGKKR
jgi:hypothetical protein